MMWNLHPTPSARRGSCGSSGAAESNDEHREKERLTGSRGFESEYGSNDTRNHNRSVRFQVVVWYIGPIDVVLGLVKMKFRVSIYWDAPSPEEHRAMAKQGYVHPPRGAHMMFFFLPVRRRPKAPSKVGCR